MNCNFIGMSNLFHNNKDSSGELFQGWSFEKENYIFFIAGIISVILGYIVFIPSALIYKNKRLNKD